MKPFKLLSLLVLIFCLVLAWTACSSSSNGSGNPPPVGPVTDFVYVANTGGAPSTVAAFSADRTTGALTEIAGSPYDAGSSSSAIAVNPAGTFLFVANYSSGDISVLSINPSTGELTPVNGSPFACEFGVDAIAVDPTGRYLFAVTGLTAGMWTYSISAAGALTPNQGSPYNQGFGYGLNNTSITASPDGKYVYVTNSQTGMFPYDHAGIYEFNFDPASGNSTPAVPFSTNVHGVQNTAAFDPSGNFLLVTGSDGPNLMAGVSVFAVDALTGVLTQVPPNNPLYAVLVGHGPAAVITDHSGKFVYIPNTVDATISAFTLDSTGLLTEISGSPFPGGGNGAINGPTGIATDTSGKFLYVCNASNDISVFKIDQSSGALTPVPGSPFSESGSGPHGIVFVHGR